MSGGASLRDRAGGLRPEPPAASQPKAPIPCARHNRWFSADEITAVLVGRAHGQTYRQIAYGLGRTHGAVKGFVARNGICARKVEWPLR